MMKAPSPEVSALFKIGATDIHSEWPDYPKLYNLGKEHIIELVELITTSNLSIINVGVTKKKYAPMHAWRALGQLKAESTVLRLLYTMAEDKNDEAIWFTIELPRVIGLIGPKAIEFIEVYINDPKVAWSFKIYAVESLVNIIKKHPESREDGIAIIEPIAANYASNDIAFNACLLKELAKINATELSSLAMRMLEEGWVDFDFVDNEAIEKVLG